ncbi:sigma-54-dependent Fis family transcriptional regulator [Ammoniphilus sp. YIM 78166]|uniref:sigma-54 interaction domain-containing protein n=1 Tax=Ammoniphilus sp. YIM 78166 TaxID=1644106 RepID=UPI00107044B1|nr:sigma 54-interacting transcriptional regulator [Ammoniphilus sp. YIM 78166]
MKHGAYPTELEMKELLETNKDLNAILSSIYDEILVVDPQGTIIRVSDHFLAEFWNVKPDQIIGQNILELESKGLIDLSVTHQVLEHKTKISIIQETWNGRRILATGTPILNENGDLERIVVASRDITETSKLKNELKQVKSNSEKLKQELDVLENRLSKSFVVYSDNMKEVLKQAEKVASASATVLLIGESGVGKEMVASAIHQLGERSSQPFVKVNCGAIPEHLLESELFGYKRGAFTGADPKGKIGYFTQANHGILFLDEISEMPLNLQVKLLRVLQEREVTPIGEIQSIPIDVQVIAATNKNLEELVKKGAFREDLYYRLHVIPISIPPLRERAKDIAFLAHHFVNKYNLQYKREVELTPDAIDLLKVYPWHGNVRELENVIQRVVVTSEEKQVCAQALNQMIPWKKSVENSKPIVTNIMPLQEALDHVEEQLILMAMEQYKSLKMVAQVLEVSQPTMSRKYQKIKEKLQHQNMNPADRAHTSILEEELNKQLMSVAIVTATSIDASDVKQLIGNLSADNPYYLKLQNKLTMIRELEGKIEWNYIFTVNANRGVINLVADKRLKLYPGEEYFGPPEIMKCMYQAMKGKVGVTPLYEDIFGQLKSSVAPIKDDSGNIVAILGSDFSADYVNTQINKLKKLFKGK